MKPDGVNYLYFKLRIFDPKEFIFWNMVYDAGFQRIGIIIIIIITFIAKYLLNLQNCQKIKKHAYVNVQYCYK